VTEDRDFDVLKMLGFPVIKVLRIDEFRRLITE